MAGDTFHALVITCTILQQFRSELWNVYQWLTVAVTYVMGRIMAGSPSAEYYHQHATEMWAQVARAESNYLKGVYSAIAENWEQLAAQMEAGTVLAEQLQRNGQKSEP
jgi:lipopolysaccharide biosynthesis regulator YciM